MKQIAALVVALISLTFFIGANCDSGDFQTSYFFCCDSSNANANCTSDQTQCPAGGCSTGQQSFTNGQNECAVLQIDAANNNCAIIQRLLWYYNIGCSGVFDENPPMAPPTNVTIVAGPTGSATLTLSWTPPVSYAGALVFQIYRGTSSGGEGLIYLNAQGTSFQDTAVGGLVSNTEYFYEIAAANVAGTSGLSLEVSATAP